MHTLLEIPAVREHAARLSVEDYHRLGELPVELLRGTIIDKMSKSPLHRFAAHALRDLLQPQLPTGFLIFSESPLTLGDSEPEPDLCVVRGTAEQFRNNHPATADLVIEVAVSSLEIDRVKALIYAEAGVTEYWIVCPAARVVEVYREPGPEGYASQFRAGPADVLECVALTGVKVSLAVVLS